MVLEGIQNNYLRKIYSKVRVKKTSGVDAESKLNEIFATKYRIRLENQLLTDHGVFYPQARTIISSSKLRSPLLHRWSGAQWSS